MDSHVLQCVTVKTLEWNFHVFALHNQVPNLQSLLVICYVRADDEGRCWEHVLQNLGWIFTSWHCTIKYVISYRYLSSAKFGRIIRGDIGNDVMLKNLWWVFAFWHCTNSVLSEAFNAIYYGVKSEARHCALAAILDKLCSEFWQ